MQVHSIAVQAPVGLSDLIVCLCLQELKSGGV